MCYHSQRREALARLEHETGLHEANDDRPDRAESHESHDPDDADSEDEHRPERTTPEQTRRPEPVGFA